MQVKFYASIRQAVGTKMVEVEVHPGATVRDILTEVTQQYPVLDKILWKEPGELSKQAHVFINGENVLHLDGLDTQLKPEDKVDIFPPLVGGVFPSRPFRESEHWNNVITPLT